MQHQDFYEISNDILLTFQSFLGSKHHNSNDKNSTIYERCYSIKQSASPRSWRFRWDSLKLRHEIPCHLESNIGHIITIIGYGICMSSIPRTWHYRCTIRAIVCPSHTGPIHDSICDTLYLFNTSTQITSIMFCKLMLQLGNGYNSTWIQIILQSDSFSWRDREQMTYECNNIHLHDNQITNDYHLICKKNTKITYSLISQLVLGLQCHSYPFLEPLQIYNFHVIFHHESNGED